MDNEAVKKAIFEKRENLLKLLETTKSSEPDFSRDDTKNASTVRFYKMTNSEYDSEKMHCFFVIFGKKPNGEDKREGFCYDIRMLNHDKCILMNNYCYFPIPCSSSRWAKIKDTLGSSIYGYQVGERTLGWPLLQSDLHEFFKNYSDKVFVLTTQDMFGMPQTEYKWPKSVFWFFDSSSTDRFSQTKKDISEVKEITIKEGHYAQFAADYTSISSKAFTFVKTIGTFPNDASISKEIESNKNLIYQMLVAGNDPEKIFGCLIDNILFRPLRKEKNQS